MTQKLLESEKSVEDLLQAIDPKGIADESMRRTVEILLNLVEELNSRIQRASTARRSSKVKSQKSKSL